MRRHRRAVAVVAGAAAALVAFPGGALAQSCAGFPSLPGRGSGGATVAFPDGGTELGLEGSLNRPGPFGLFASVTVQNADGELTEDMTTFGAGVVYEVGHLLPFVPDRLAACTVAGVQHLRLETSTRLYFPLGFGVATPFELSPDGATLVPHLMPRFVPTRVSVDGITIRDYHFGIGFGVLASFAPLYAGVAFDHLLVDRAPLEWALRAGLTFDWR
jgi:hypothetical protein